jgi:hypothetical protein
MKMKTNLVIEADIAIRIRETGEEQKLTVRDLPCTWVWAEGSRDAAEYWAVSDWIAKTFGNNIDWFNVICIVSSSVKEEK